MRAWLASPEATDRFGALLAATRPARAVVHLHGDLGAGKSSLARAVLRALGVRGAIRSPTYTLVERYPLTDTHEAVHLDLYRIGDPGELEFLGLDPAEGALWLIEWPERGGSHLPAADLDIALALKGEGRVADLVAQSPVGEAWIAGLVEHSDLQAFHDPA
jgi:tRNA threonylcarbamoyladenosine biosynthesis protein TsaE